MRKTLPWRWPLHWQILLGLMIGAAVGWAIGASAVSQIPAGTAPEKMGIVASGIAAKSTVFLLLDLLGDLFIQGLKLIIVPLVVSSIILSIAQMSSGRDFGRLGIKTLLYYLSTSTIAILIGLTLVNAISPGIGSDGIGVLQGRDLSDFASDTAEVERRAGGRGASDFLDVFRSMVPPNIFAAAVDAQLLGLIVVALLIGFYLSRLETRSKPVLLDFILGVYDITMSITGLVLRLAPIGVIGLLGATVAEQYAKLTPDGRFPDLIGAVGKFAAVTVAALAIHMLLTFPLILTLIARVNPLRHFTALSPALAMAFSTASSSATLPVTIDCVEKRAGVSNRVASFTLPLGATVNMDGTALYECVAAIFICQAMGVDLSFAQQFMIVVVALLTSIGVAGVPAASLVAILVILQSVQSNLPPGSANLVTGMGLLFVFDRPLDMCRTAVNIFSDSVGAVTISRTEGETPLGSTARRVAA